MTSRKTSLSVVVPVYNEEKNIPELYRRLKSVLSELCFDRTEVLLISDGSIDSTDRLIRDLALQDPQIKGILLSRNFGHQAAVGLGLSLAEGEFVAVIDGDLQDPPELLPKLVELCASGVDVAYGVRIKRKENILLKSAYALFYRVLKQAASITIPLDSGDFCCMKRQVVDALLTLPERTRFIRGLRAWVGFRQAALPYERDARFAGSSNYTFRKLVRLAYDGLFSFSSIPVHLMQAIGFVMSAAALAVALFYFTWFWFEPGKFPSGFATLAISIWFLGGVQLFVLGILGEYLVRTFDETRRRPIAIVREIVTQPRPPEKTPRSEPVAQCAT